ncbi:FAS1 domain-containing protein [Lasiosphaeria hispida]|uniref:FAS1 domain-containing protein n=1 Tax=Lasiosphaeria hispida TaxID=260671 RepID=A0AAJ0M8W2_9PEZI|nr:FAS1 domain-containing protein [Lasiosphaeria hispida]
MTGKLMLELFALLAVLAASSLAQSNILAVLRQEGFTEFADFLAASVPDLLSGPETSLIVYAPTNAAFRRRKSSSDLLRRDDDEDCLYQIAQDVQVSGNTKRGYSYGHENGVCSEVTSPGAADFMTFLDDPDFVNLPPNNNASIVQKNMPKGALPVVHSGLGDVVKVTGLDIPFDKGVIRPVSGLFSLPRLLSFTLPFLGTDKALAALEQTGLINDLDNRTGITFLAPDDRAIPNNISASVLAEILRRHTIVGLPIFTSDLRNGDTYQTLAGTTITVTVQCADVFIGGARILASDAIIKNGVVHTVDKLFEGPIYVTTTEVQFKTVTETTTVPTIKTATTIIETTKTATLPPPPPPPPTTTTVIHTLPPPPPTTVTHTPPPHPPPPPPSLPPHTTHSLPSPPPPPPPPPPTYQWSTLVTSHKSPPSPPTTKIYVHETSTPGYEGGKPSHGGGDGW